MKKVVVIVAPLILVVGGVVAAGIMGVINIPGLSPKKVLKQNAMYGETPDLAINRDSKSEPAPKLQAEKPAVKPAEEKVEPKLDPTQGAKKLAKLWNELESKKLADIAKKWKDRELALVIASMEPEKASALLSQFDAARAATISAAIQHEASIVR